MVKNMYAIGCCTATKKTLCFVFAVCYFQQRKPKISQKFQKGFMLRKNPRISEHENSNEHQRCSSDWKICENNLKEGKTMDSDLQRVISAEMKKWREILKGIVDAILFCAKDNLALRGTTEIIGQQSSAIFLNLFELISHYYPLVAAHIASV